MYDCTFYNNTQVVNFKATFILELNECMYVCMYVCTYVRTYVCMYVFMYVCMYVCMYICMYINVFGLTSIFK